METKDLFFSAGIIFTTIASAITLYLGFKNRRNTLREHLYKEQFAFFLLFLKSVNKLNFEIEGLINDPEKRKQNNFYENLEVVSNEYYNCEFLLTNELSGLINNLIFQSNKFYTSYLSTNKKEYNLFYNKYFDSYTSMLNYIRDFIGTNELSKENKILHSQEGNISKNSVLKLIMEISENFVASRF